MSHELDQPSVKAGDQNPSAVEEMGDPQVKTVDGEAVDQPENLEEEEEEEEEEEQETVDIANDAVASEIRAAGIAAFNARRYHDALKIQFVLLKHFTRTLGETNARCGQYYLDYGVTLLNVIQEKDAEAGALAGNTGEEDEDITICHQNLELARVCFDKCEDDLDNETQLKELQKKQAEVHEALAQLHHERDDDVEALKDWEFALVLRRNSFGETDRVVASTMFEIGLLYLRNEEYEKAAAMLSDAILTARDSNVPQEIVDDMQQFLEEAREFAEGGGFGKVKQEINDLFPDSGPSSIPVESEFDGLVSAVPAELASMPHNNRFVGGMVPGRENSSSMSFFPTQTIQGEGRPINLEVTRVNTAVTVRRKGRSVADKPDVTELTEKRHRPEN